MYAAMYGGETLSSLEVCDLLCSNGADGRSVVYVAGGLDAEDTALDRVGVYDFVTETWSILPALMPQARTYINNAVVQHKGKVYVVGGMNEEGE
jgi:N-acetylneuraminic acid mutarotase